MHMLDLLDVNYFETLDSLVTSRRSKALLNGFTYISFLGDFNDNKHYKKLYIF